MTSTSGTRGSHERTVHVNLRTVSMFFILVAMWVVFRLQVGEFYFSGESIAKLSRDMATWTILASGMTLVIICGHIDLSVGSLLALVAATCAMLMNSEYGLGLSATAAVPIALLCGTVLGVMQGVLISYLRIPSFIVTLGGLFIFRGLTHKVSAYDPRIPDTSWVTALGFDSASPVIGWIIAIGACLIVALINFRAFSGGGAVDSRNRNVVVAASTTIVICGLILGFVYKVNDYRGIPSQTLVMIGTLIILHIVSQSTPFGRHLYAIGGNVDAARLSGIRVERNVVGVFGLMGLLTAIAAILWMAQNQGATKNAGEFYELYAIAAAVIGGSSLLGGRGTILGTFLGGLVMATVIQGMDYSNLENWTQLVVRGALLVIAVGIDIAAKGPSAWFRKARQAITSN